MYYVTTFKRCFHCQDYANPGDLHSKPDVPCGVHDDTVPGHEFACCAPDDYASTVRVETWTEHGEQAHADDVADVACRLPEITYQVAGNIYRADTCGTRTLVTIVHVGPMYGQPHTYDPMP